VINLSFRPDQIYHVAIMPCFDKVFLFIFIYFSYVLMDIKKLEASREDFYNDVYKTHDVDCVLSSLEILDILKDKNIDFTTLEASPIDTLYIPSTLLFVICFYVCLFLYFILFYLLFCCFPFFFPFYYYFCLQKLTMQIYQYKRRNTIWSEGRIRRILGIYFQIRCEGVVQC
jgi:Iron only hydrogenase large subunit, C-terminal domain